MTATIDLIARYLKEEDKENANKFESYTKLRGYIADHFIKEWSFTDVYTPDIVEAHENGFFHIHDLSDGLVPYCKGHDATKLMVHGLKTQTVIADPPRHLSSFFDQCVNLIAYNQQHWAGAMAISNINTLAAPYIRKYYGDLIKHGLSEKEAKLLTYRYVKQCVQSFIYNLNFPSRAGSQTPFSNITLNFSCPPQMKGEPVLVPGVEGTWDEFDFEGKMLLQAFNEVYYHGDAKGRPFTFPIPTINLLPETDYEDPLFLEIIKTVLKFGTYSFFNYDGSGIDPNTILSMCCRLQIDLTELAPTGGRWAYSGETGSLGVVTFNMAKLGYLANSEEHFFEILEDLLSKARRALLMKGLFIEANKHRFMPYDTEMGTDLRRFFRTIGVVGLHEMCVNMFGKPLSESVSFVQKVLHFIREWTRTTQQETGVLWNVEMTPAEGCATRLAMRDKELYGEDIFTQGVEGAYYYTSMITPPSQDLGIVSRIEVEQELLPLFTGGTVHRIFIGEQKPDPVQAIKLIRAIAKHTKITYFDLAATFGVCSVCSHEQRGDSPICEEDGEAMYVYDRIVGYYRPRSQANSGKYREIIERKVAIF
jgi:ribonucleoside-triphosphate reductase